MNIRRLKLFHCPASRSARVKWLLHELLDRDFDVEVVQLYQGAQYRSDYLRMNPNHNVPVLQVTLENGGKHIMLESGAMIALLADLYPEKGLAPAATGFSPARADYLQMLHFGASTMDMMLWQIRIHTHLLGSDSDARTIARYKRKFAKEVEPQLAERLERAPHICGELFSAADCVMGQNVLWARAYGLCQQPVFEAYLERLSRRPAYALAFADLGEFSVAPPPALVESMGNTFPG